MEIAYLLNQLVACKAFLYTLEIFLCCAAGDFCVEPAGCEPLDSEGCIPKDCLFLNIYHKHLVVAYTKTCWHDAGVCDNYVRHCLFSINGFGSAEENGTNSFSCKVTDHFKQMESVFIGECLANGLLIYILAGVEAYNKSIPLISLFLQLLDEILSEALSRTRKVYFLLVIKYLG